MSMHSCPHCGGPGITQTRKLSLGPAVPATCRSCGRKIGVPWSGMLTMVPCFAGAQAAMFFRTPLAVAAAVAGVLAMFLLWRYVPLVKR
jgi:hypothetical protein